MSPRPFTAAQAGGRTRPEAIKAWATWLMLGLSLCLAGCGGQPSDTGAPPAESGAPGADRPAPAAGTNLPATASPRLFPFCRDGKWGYINVKGNVVIEPRYRYAYDFCEGLGTVDTPEGTRYIDEKGEIICVAPQGHRWAWPFSEGLAAFAVGERFKEKWGFFDRQGKVIVEPKYDEVRSFSEGRAAVNLGAKAEEHTDLLFGGKWGFIDTEGRLVIEPRYRYAHDFCEGLAVVNTGSGFIYLDKNGKVAFQFDYASVFPAHGFSEGLAPVYVSIKGGREDKVVYVDKTGTIVLEPPFPGGGDFSEGLAPAYSDEGHGYIDRSGRVVIKPRRGVGGGFLEGLAPFEIDNKCGYIDKQGEFVIDPHDDHGGLGTFNDAREFRGGLARVHVGGFFDTPYNARHRWSGGAWYYINRQGKIVSPYRRDDELGSLHGKEDVCGRSEP